jgi:hypothetical protein
VRQRSTGGAALSVTMVGVARWQGEWEDNLRHGSGKMTYASGNIYQGEMRRDRKTGHGVMQWFNLRERYAGEWLEDLQHGFGEHVWMEDKPADTSYGIMKQVSNRALGCEPRAQSW